MEHKVYLIIRGGKYGGREVLSAYSSKTLAEQESDRLNIPRHYGIVYYVEELKVIDFDGA